MITHVCPCSGEDAEVLMAFELSVSHLFKEGNQGRCVEGVKYKVLTHNSVCLTAHQNVFFHGYLGAGYWFVCTWM